MDQALQVRGLGFAEALAKQLTLRESEAVGFGETYSDLIAFVLRWVETMASTGGGWQS
jgi:hypothetical protein